MKRPRRAPVVLVLWLMLTTLGWAQAIPANADTSTVATGVEAWYYISPVCLVPIECPALPDAPPAQAFPADTLHVAVALGQEFARTYITLDTGALPFDASIVGGTLSLPVAGADAGTVSPETAKLRACLVRDQFEAAQGSVAEAPFPDCGFSAPATFAPGTDFSVFTVNLAPIADVWRAEPGLSRALAIMPAEEVVAERATWHVAFHAKNRSAPDARPITARIDYTIAETPTAPELPTFSPPVFNPGFFVGPLPPAPAPPVAQPPAVVQQPPPRPVAARGFAYPMVWWIPIVFLVVGGFLGRSLTRDELLPAV